MTELQLTDLRSVTRNPERFRTEVTVNLGWSNKVGKHGGIHWFKWLVFGECSLRQNEGSEKPASWWLQAHLTAGVTDGEHDSAQAVRLPLIGVTFGSIYHHRVQVYAYVQPSASQLFEPDFHVPLPGYNPVEGDDVHICKSCEEPHPMVNYIPEHNAELYQLVEGRPVRIYIGDPYEDR